MEIMRAYAVTRKGMPRLLVMIALLVNVACSQSDSGGQFADVAVAPIVQRDSVQLQLFSDTELITPFPLPVTVIVYGVDSQEILRVIEADNGEAIDLGEFDEEISVTLAYRHLLGNRELQLQQLQTTPETLNYSVNDFTLQSVIGFPIDELSLRNGIRQLVLSADIESTTSQSEKQDLSITVSTQSLPSAPEGAFRYNIPSVQPRRYLPPIGPVFGFVPATPCEPYFANGLATQNDYDIAERHVQDDGQVSFLSWVATAYSATMSQYGLLLDQQVSDGSQFSIPTDMVPTTIPVVADGYEALIADDPDFPETNIFVVVSGERKGVSYDLSPRKYMRVNPSPGTEALEGRALCEGVFEINRFPNELQIADQFPVDDFITKTDAISNLENITELSVVGADKGFYTSDRCRSAQRSEEYPQQINVEPAAFSFESLELNRSAKSISWLTETPESLEWQRVTIQPLHPEIIYVDALWEIAFPGNGESLQLPALPTELAEELASMVEPESMNLTLSGTDYMPGPQQLFLNGIDSQNITTDVRTQCTHQSIVIVNALF